VGWVGIGPLFLHLMIEVAGRPAPRLRRMLPPLYLFSLLLVLLEWTTDWVHPGVERTAWGWAYRVGPIFPIYYGVTVVALLAAIGLGFKVYRSTPSQAERSQIRWLGVGIAIPLVVASLTDGILPMFDVQVVRLGSPSCAALGAAVALTLYRFGYSILAPGAFAHEIVETVPDGLALLHPDGRIRTANGALAELAVCAQSELVGRAISELLSLPLVYPVQELECELTPIGGKAFPVSISASRLQDKQGHPTGLVLSVRDLREVVALRQRLLISGRMAAVGQLAAGVAHEINNPMAYVRSNLIMLRQHWQRMADPEGAADDGMKADDWPEILAEGEELIDESLDGVERTAAIVREITGFSHAGAGERERVNLNALLDWVERVSAPRTRDRARIERHDGQLPLVTCAPREIQQVFLNLVLNAADAVDPGGSIRIVTESDHAQVRVWIHDDGCGIDADQLDRIFDPFFTTKREGDGTGLGLALSYEIVRRHGGDLSASSDPGQGSSFCVTLPVEPVEPAEGADPDSSTP
jgi:PAS domain S-box-containing protein